MYNLPEDDKKHIPEELLRVIADAATGQCDELDGVEDGIISAPEKCDVDLEAVSCDREGANKSQCLTKPQLETAKKIYADFYVDGKFVWSGYDAGSEMQWPAVISTKGPSPYGMGYQRYFLHDDPDWSWKRFNDSVFSEAARKDPGEARADGYDLSKFKGRGGKIIMYHGMADGLVPTRGSSVYYDRVSNTMGGDPTDFFRYFLVPGMQHCWMTTVDAPWYFAAPFQASILGNDTWSVPGARDSQHDVLLALVDWVEEGKAVDSLVATTWKVANDSESGVLRQRPLCPYPQKAIYHGEGDADDAESWHCGMEEEEEENAAGGHRLGGLILGSFVIAALSFSILL